MDDKWRRKAVKLLMEAGIGQVSRESLLQSLVEAFESEIRRSQFYASYVPEPVRQRFISQQTGPQLTGERRLATVLFVDVCGFTSISEQLDPETVVDMLNTVFDMIVSVTSSQGGSVDKFLGDAALLSFGAPVTRGDDAVRALITALEIQEKMSALSFPNALVNNESVRFQVSIGIHTGLVIAHNIGGEKRKEYTVIGDTVNISARLRELAQPGEIIVSDAVREQTRDQFVFTSIGACTLKGKKRQISAYLLGNQTRHTLGLAAAQSRLFVGRSDEIAVLDEAFEAITHNHFRRHIFRGIAGIGKSCLLRHWLDITDTTDTTTLWIAANFESRESQLSFLIRLFCQQIDLYPTGSNQPRIRKRLRAVIRKFKGTSYEQEAATNSILQVLFPEHGQATDLNQTVSSQFIDAVITLMELVARKQPMIFVLDNYQWVDEASHTLIKQILDRSSNLSLLVIILSRPDPKLDDLSGDLHELKGLDGQAATELVSNYLEDHHISGVTVDDIVSRAKDHPLFLELLLNHVIHRPRAPHEGTSTLPPDINSAIMTLVDNLPEDTRQVIQACSIIGNRMYADLVSGVINQFTDLGPVQLKKLCEGGFLQFNPTENLYQFQQDLIREVVYDTVLLKMRRKWHQMTGTVMESLSDPNRFTPEMLAYHFKNGQDPEKGIFYLELAAQYADFLHQNKVSINLYRQALDILSSDSVPRPNKEWKFRFQLAQSFFVKGNLETARDYFLESLKIAQTAESPLQEGETLIKLGDIYSDMGSLPESIPFYEQAIAIFEEHQEYEGEIKAINALGIIYTQLGDLEKARDAFERGVECASITTDHQLAGMVYSNFGIFNSLQNKTDEAISAYLSSLYYFEQAGSLEGVAHSYHNLGTSYEKAGDLDNAETYYRKSMQVSLETDDLTMIGSTLLNRSQLWLQRGDLTMAEALVREALSRMEGLRNPMVQAEAYLTLGKISEKKNLVDQARKEFALSYRLNKSCHNLLGIAAAGHEYGRVLLKQETTHRAERYLKIALDAYTTVGDSGGADAVKALLDSISDASDG